jgi:hypothetical protein
VAAQVQVGWDPGKGHYFLEPGSGCLFRGTGYCELGEIQQALTRIPGILHRELFLLLEGIKEGAILRIRDRT